MATARPVSRCTAHHGACGPSGCRAPANPSRACWRRRPTSPYRVITTETADRCRRLSPVDGRLVTCSRAPTRSSRACWAAARTSRAGARRRPPDRCRRLSPVDGRLVDLAVEHSAVERCHVGHQHGQRGAGRLPTATAERIYGVSSVNRRVVHDCSHHQRQFGGDLHMGRQRRRPGPQTCNVFDVALAHTVSSFDSDLKRDPTCTGPSTGTLAHVGSTTGNSPIRTSLGNGDRYPDTRRSTMADRPDRQHGVQCVLWSPGPSCSRATTTRLRVTYTLRYADR